MSIALIILAAGSSSRLGTPKQLIYYRGGTLLGHTIDAALASACSPVIVVLGSHSESMYLELEDVPVHTVLNTGWEEGMGSSLRSGMQALEEIAPDAEAVIFAVCDQPFLSSEVIDRLTQRYRETGCPIVASAYAREVGVPALFDQMFFDELAQTNGDHGAKRILKQHREIICSVDFPGGEVDIDTSEDALRLAECKPPKPRRKPRILPPPAHAATAHTERRLGRAVAP